MSATRTNCRRYCGTSPVRERYARTAANLHDPTVTRHLTTADSNSKRRCNHCVNATRRARFLTSALSLSLSLSLSLCLSFICRQGDQRPPSARSIPCIRRTHWLTDRRLVPSGHAATAGQHCWPTERSESAAALSLQLQSAGNSRPPTYIAMLLKHPAGGRELLRHAAGRRSVSLEWSADWVSEPVST